MPDSKSFGVGRKMRQTSGRRMRCPNKSANGNRLGQNYPHPPTIDDKDFSGILRRGPRELRYQQPHEPFISLLQLRELPAKTLNLEPFAVRQTRPVKV